jgi:uncharacterized protein (TIGR00255 family)
MTGFGDATGVFDGVAYAVELRSVNNRYFKATLRLPDELMALEPELESYLRRRINRGSLTLAVSFKDSSAAAAHEINESALASYLAHLETIEGKALSEMRHRVRMTVDLASLLVLPGVVQQPDQSARIQKARSVVPGLIDKAIDKMLAMRDVEGRALHVDFNRHIQVITDRLASIAARAPQVVEEYHQRLQARIKELLERAQLRVAEPDVIREVALYAEKCDISEEVQRLSAHLQQFDQIVRQDGSEPAGRTLDFVAQEMLREANTIGSKSNDATISRAIVEIKGAIDRMKEQVQNVE